MDFVRAYLRDSPGSSAETLALHCPEAPSNYQFLGEKMLLNLLQQAQLQMRSPKSARLPPVQETESDCKQQN